MADTNNTTLAPAADQVSDMGQLTGLDMLEHLLYEAMAGVVAAEDYAERHTPGMDGNAAYDVQTALLAAREAVERATKALRVVMPVMPPVLPVGVIVDGEV